MNVLLVLQVIIYGIHDRMAAMMRKSPNDVRLASKVSFFSLCFVFFILTDVLLYIQVINYYDGYDNEVGIGETRAGSRDSGMPDASQALG